MKKDLFIKILKYLGVGLIGAFVGMGALAGVSSCYSHNNVKETAKVQTSRPKHYRKLGSSNIDEIIGSDKVYYAQLKRYANPNGFLYQDSITLENSRIMGAGYLFLGLEATILKGSNSEQDRFEIATALNGGVYKLNSIWFYNGTNYTYIYNVPTAVYNRDNSGFVFTNARFYSTASNSQNLSYFVDLFDIYDLSTFSMSYDFDNAFNFNNFYQVNDTFYAQPYSPVVGATTTTTGWEKTYSVGLFYSGGLMFDSIKVTFGRNIGYYFETGPNSNEYLQFPTNVANAYNYYFLQMEYINSATNFTITACNRTSYSKNGSSYIQFLPAWASQAFKTLEFQNDINNIFVRSVFNSLSDTEQLNQPVITTNVGLSSVFSLLSMAFTAWLPIFNISIVPGVTIGLLLFMPLVVGIIILVIWIVKR